MKSKRIKIEDSINYEIVRGAGSIPVMKYSFEDKGNYTIERTISGNNITARLTIINHISFTETLIEPINRRFAFKKYIQMLGYQNFYGHGGGAGSISFNQLIDDGTTESFGFNGYNIGENDILDLSYGLSTSSPSYYTGYNLPDLSSTGITCTYTPNAIPEADGDIRIIFIEGSLI